MLDLALVTVSPANAAANALAAVPGATAVTEIKLEAHKKGARLKVEEIGRAHV